MRNHRPVSSVHPPHDPERSTVIALRGVVWSILLAVVLASMTVAQQYDPRLFDGMRWRLIGPFRGGRPVATVGVSGRPDRLYIGVNNGGAGESHDYRRTPPPHLAQHTPGSHGANPAAPAHPAQHYLARRR